MGAGHVRAEGVGGEEDSPAVGLGQVGGGDVAHHVAGRDDEQGAGLDRPGPPAGAQQPAGGREVRQAGEVVACSSKVPVFSQLWSSRLVATGSSPGAGSIEYVAGPSPAGALLTVRTVESSHGSRISVQVRSPGRGQNDDMTEKLSQSRSERDYIPGLGRQFLTPLYDVAHRVFGLHSVHNKMIELAELRGGHRVLDVGCGTGNLLRATGRRHRSVDLVGLDPDPKALIRAERKARRAASPFAWTAGSRRNCPMRTARSTGSSPA
ncbi:methyltransferase domain-containing protein [Streptomyces sp. T1317-0309]|nr:methyltransferase domain-containing protein [Streptomyces sp. T1317-0309]